MPILFSRPITASPLHLQAIPQLTPKSLARAALRGTATAGIRSIFCYAPTRRVTSWDPFTVDTSPPAPWVMSTFETLAAQGPWEGGRIRLGFGYDGVAAPAEVIKPLYERVRKAGSHLITSHAVAGPMFGNPPSALSLLASHSLLAPDILLSHANFPSPDDTPLLAENGASISSTPSTELQMGMSAPVALLPSHFPHASIGTDCHSIVSPSIPGQMSLLLQSARAARHAELAAEGNWSRDVGSKCEDVYNLGTIKGARAAGLADEVGRLKIGMKADLCIFDALGPSMVGAAQEDPVAAIVLHSTPRDIETVIIDGIIRKRDGKLVKFETVGSLRGKNGEEENFDGGTNGSLISWKEIAEEVLKSRTQLNEKLAKIDVKAAEEGIMNMLKVNRNGIVE